MNRTQFARCGSLIGGAIGAAVGFGVATGNYLLIIVAVVLGVVAEYVCKRCVSEIVEDELVYRLSERAALRAFQAFALTAGLGGALLVAFGNQLPGLGQLRPVGMTLAFSACSLLLLYLVFYSYYARKGMD